MLSLLRLDSLISARWISVHKSILIILKLLTNSSVKYSSFSLNWWEPFLKPVLNITFSYKFLLILGPWLAFNIRRELKQKAAFFFFLPHFEGLLVDLLFLRGDTRVQNQPNCLLGWKWDRGWFWHIDIPCNCSVTYFACIVPLTCIIC